MQIVLDLIAEVLTIAMMFFKQTSDNGKETAGLKGEKAEEHKTCSTVL